MKQLLFILSLFVFSISLTAQGYLHTEGKYIYNGNGEPVILRGIGTGNWMLLEGYMMQTGDVAGTQHEFRARLEETIGKTRADSFYNAWLQYHFTRTDVDSMKSWGFNSVRVAMHYKWFTPPIEDELVEGEITWIDKGFDMLDSLLTWCEDNEMYLILDLHGAPGGQGKDANISDYDPTKPSLWESDFNKDKTVALWKKLAQRYANEPWIGGYDLINETNWTFPEGNNSQMRELYGRITDAIREVDANHIIFIEGNNFANDFSGLTPPWDDNMAFSFHKYWNYNKPGALDWIIQMRDNYNIPIWLGETGENSNTWFTNLIALCEKHNVGWSWWPVKKPGINNPLRVEVNEDYEKLIDSWKGEALELTEDKAFAAVLQFAENHKIENCVFQKDVVDAMIRQPHTTENLPFNIHAIEERVFFTDYDLGRNKYAYLDNDTANYHLEEGHDYTAWNQGWSYRSDGVDIEQCSDDGTLTNGYNVGWTEDGEWMLYSMSANSASACQLNIRYACGGSGGVVHLQIDGVPVTESISLNSTGGWQEWSTLSIDNVVIPEGEFEVAFMIEKGGINLNYFSFTNPQEAVNAGFKPLMAEVVFPGNKVRLILNQAISGDVNALESDNFSIDTGNGLLQASGFNINPLFPRILEIELDGFVDHDQLPVLSYDGTSLFSGELTLGIFLDFEVQNNLPVRYSIPGRIEAEDFWVNNGFELEDCQDTGGGSNTAFSNPGDYLDYNVVVTEASLYTVNYRVATLRQSSEIALQIETGEGFVSVDTTVFSSTSGWQNWANQTAIVDLPAGRYMIRLLVLESEFNLNWFEFSMSSSIQEKMDMNDMAINPVPARESINVQLPFVGGDRIKLYAYNDNGLIVRSWEKLYRDSVMLDLNGLKDGLYILMAYNSRRVAIGKFLVSPF
jgi:endoglucanase